MPQDLSGRLVLDAGCGAGRFADVALSCGARVIGVDYSSAVDACWGNLKSSRDLDVIQADIYNLPLKENSFDVVYCFGVLQHTPDVKAAFLALPRYLKTGGVLAVDVYPKLFWNVFWPKYWLRVLTKRLPPGRLFPITRIFVKLMWPVSVAIGRIPRIGRKLRYLIPVVNYEGIYPLSAEQLKEWALLDTFDMFAPTYDNPQSLETLRRWFDLAGLQQVTTFRSGLVIGRGVK